MVLISRAMYLLNFLFSLQKPTKPPRKSKHERRNIERINNERQKCEHRYQRVSQKN